MTSAHPTRAITRQRHMTQAEKIGHAVMILCTCGMWLPVYLARKRKVRETSVTTYR